MLSYLCEKKNWGGGVCLYRVVMGCGGCGGLGGLWRNASMTPILVKN